MGDRAQVHIVDDDGYNIYLYTHDNGYRLKSILGRAMERGVNQWDSPDYLTRIIFSEMITGRLKDTYGFGINNQGYGESGFIVDVANQKIVKYEAVSEGIIQVKQEWTFEDFVKETLESRMRVAERCRKK